MTSRPNDYLDSDRELPMLREELRVVDTLGDNHIEAGAPRIVGRSGHALKRLTVAHTCCAMPAATQLCKEVHEASVVAINEMFQ